MFFGQSTFLCPFMGLPQVLQLGAFLVAAGVGGTWLAKNKVKDITIVLLHCCRND